MAFADIDDVARLLQRDLTADEQTQLTESLAVAEEHVAAIVGDYTDFDGTPPGTMTFWDVYEDGMLKLPLQAATITDVRVYAGYGVDVAPILLAEGATYDLIDSDTIRLRTTTLIEAFENAYGRRVLGSWNRVEVDYTYDGSIPASIRDATAAMAIGIWQAGPSIIEGGELIMEKIGDYEYKRATGMGSSTSMTPEDFISFAIWMLRPYTRGKIGGVRVV